MRAYLDDERNPKKHYDVIWRSVDEAKKWILRRGMPSHISFDHDLGQDQPTGMDLARFLVELDLNPHSRKEFPKDFTFNVHSANPVGGSNIKNLLLCYLEGFKGMRGVMEK